MSNVNSRSAWLAVVDRLNEVRARLGIGTYKRKQLATLAQTKGHGKKTRTPWAAQWAETYEWLEGILAANPDVTAREVDQAFQDSPRPMTPTEYRRFVEELLEEDEDG